MVCLTGHTMRCPVQSHAMRCTVPSTRINLRRQQRLVCSAEATDAPSAKPPRQQMLVYVPPHPLVKHWLAVVRNSMSPTPVFRKSMAELGRILIYEAVRDWLPTVDMDVPTPMGIAEGTVVDPSKPVKVRESLKPIRNGSTTSDQVVPVLRAGLVLLEMAETVIPSQETYHVGYVRNEETLEATEYLNKLPKTLSKDDLVLVSDPMLATGGTIIKVLDDIVARGADISNVRVVSVVAAPPALTKLSERYPGLKVYSAMIDAEVNEQGFIIPGLGDAGDRAFGTGAPMAPLGQ